MSSQVSAELTARAAYLAAPVATAQQPGPWPGVVVIHDILGVRDDIREQADWLAAAGYLAVVPDLFEGRAVIRCVKGVFAQLTAQQGPAFEKIETVRTALAGDELCTGTVGVIGYCMGGAFALLAAGRPGFAAASVNYGLLPENLDEVLSGACPIVASFGGRDRALKGVAAEVDAAARRAGVEVDVKEYPNAGHGFINRFAVASPLSLLKVVGVGYDHDSAADAKRRILAFFASHLHADRTADSGAPPG